MRVVVALGGNALQKRGEPMTVGNQRANVAIACAALAPVALEHELVISHGNGPQVGLLALQASAFDEVSPYPFDVLGAQTEGMIGYLIEQELGNLLPFEKPLATILTMTEVDPADPAFDDLTKFVGPVYSKHEAHRLAAERGWVIKPDEDAWRRVVPSPVPLRIFEQRPVEWLLAQGCVVCLRGRWRHPNDVSARDADTGRRGGGHRQGPRELRACQRPSCRHPDHRHRHRRRVRELGHRAPAPDPGGPPRRARPPSPFPPGRWVRRSKPQSTSRGPPVRRPSSGRLTTCRSSSRELPVPGCR
jgi:hypothetical protein